VIWCIAAATATAFAWWAKHPDDNLLLRLRLDRPSAAPLSWPPPIAILGTLSGLAMVGIRSTATQLAVLAVAGAVAFGLALHRAGAQRRRAREFRSETATFLRAWSAELRSGLAPVDAARTVAAEAAVWSPIRVATAVDVPDALLAVAAEPGGEALVDAAAAWSIADTTGAALAVVLERVSDAVQAAVDVDREVAVEAAPARATARLMAFLPLIGILLGTSLGADPIGVLIGTGLGVGCLLLGLSLACIGVWWIERLVAAVEP
jgi:tight adherence protein B